MSWRRIRTLIVKEFLELRQTPRLRPVTRQSLASDRL